MNKKRLIIIDFIFLISTFLIFLLSLFSISSKLQNDSILDLNNYVSIIDNIYQSDDYLEEIDDYFKDLSSFRITILSYKDGSVIYDNNKNYNKEENRLDEFILHQDGKAYYKVSLTTSKDTLYVVKRSKSTLNFIRLGITKNEVLNFTYNVSIVGSILLLILNLIFFYLSYLYYKNNIKSLKLEINKLNTLVNDTSIINNEIDIESIKEMINKTYSLLDLKIKELESEKNQNTFILDNMDEGFIILDDKFNIKEINKYAYSIFNINNDIKNKNILYLENGSIIENNLKDLKDYKTFEFVNNDSYYEVISRFIKFNDQNLISLIFLNVSDSRRIEKSKKEFFMNASHELKSPLTSIIGYEELIKEGIINKKEDIDRINEIILKESLRMKRIVLNMLEISKLENNIESIKEMINFKDIILSILDDLKGEIELKNIRVETNLTNLNYLINKEESRSLIFNLISNAINYNKVNGSICINIKDNIISIKDTGIGIKKDDINHIFERFYMVDKARSKEKGSTGLGLSICKHIALNNHIEIKVNSKVDEGSEFLLIFPL